MEKRHFNYDYSQTLWMKMFLARPDFEHNRSEVLITFDEALDIIKTVDKLTQGIQKIVYLVGWQGLGHDDCFPEMEKVNTALCGDSDLSGKEYLYQLFEEAKKYNTVVSFHGNVADCYSQNPSFDEFVKADAILKDKDGNPAVIEMFNGRNAYKTSYKQYWESGLFKKYWDRFCEATPVREAGTVHLDNFCIAQNLNPYTPVEEEIDARNKMLDYIYSLGIDVTTEYTYREQELRADSTRHPIRKYYETFYDELPVSDFGGAPIHTLGRIPAAWHLDNVTPEDCVRIQPQEYSGRLTDAKLRAVFYNVIHGEDIWMEKGVKTEDWSEEFVRQFCLQQLPYFYLNRHKRLSIEKSGKDYTAYFSGGVISDGKTLSITENGIKVKDGDNVLLPLDEENRTFIAYSENGKAGEWNIPGAAPGKAEIFEITPDGNVPLGIAEIKRGKINLDVKPCRALAVKAPTL